MKVLIEGDPLFGRRTGVGQYVKGLLSALFAIESRNTYTVYGFLFMGRRQRWPFLPKGPGVRYRYIRFLPGRVYNRLRKHLGALPVDLLLGEKFDIALFTNFKRLPLVFTRRSAVIIYDVTFLLHPEYIEERNLRDLNRTIAQTIRRSTHIVTISNSARDEIIRHFNLPEERISVVGPAIDHSFFFPRPASEIASVAKKYAIPGHYVLYAGTLEPRKNITGILDAYERLPKKLREEFHLVLAGGKGWKDSAIIAKVAAGGTRIIVTGYVADEDLPALYSGASLFVFPSHYEGFGMPVLEAMACGCPVITSNNSSLPEVAGDAGILIESTDTAALTAQVEAVLTQPDQAKKMRRRGLERALQFNWEQSARQLQGVFEKIASL